MSQANNLRMRLQAQHATLDEQLDSVQVRHSAMSEVVRDIAATGIPIPLAVDARFLELEISRAVLRASLDAVGELLAKQDELLAKFPQRQEFIFVPPEGQYPPEGVEFIQDPLRTDVTIVVNEGTDGKFYFRVPTEFISRKYAAKKEQERPATSAKIEELAQKLDTRVTEKKVPHVAQVKVPGKKK